MTHGIASFNPTVARSRRASSSPPRGLRSSRYHARNVRVVHRTRAPPRRVRSRLLRARSRSARRALGSRRESSAPAVRVRLRRASRALQPRAPRPRSRAALSVAAAAPAAAVTATMTSLQFTPVHAPCGGALLGIASIAKLALTGRVLGVSESFKRPLTGDVRGSDAAFVAGLLFAGAMHTAISGGVAAMPHEPMVPPRRRRSRASSSASAAASATGARLDTASAATRASRRARWRTRACLCSSGSARRRSRGPTRRWASRRRARYGTRRLPRGAPPWRTGRRWRRRRWRRSPRSASSRPRRGSSTARTRGRGSSGKTGNAGLDPILVSESDSVGATTNAQRTFNNERSTNVQRRPARQKKLDVVSDSSSAPSSAPGSSCRG